MDNEHLCLLCTVKGVTRAECLECDYIGSWHDDTFTAVKDMNDHEQEFEDDED